MEDATQDPGVPDGVDVQGSGSGGGHVGVAEDSEVTVTRVRMSVAVAVVGTDGQGPTQVQCDDEAMATEHLWQAAVQRAPRPGAALVGDAGSASDAIMHDDGDDGSCLDIDLASGGGGPATAGAADESTTFVVDRDWRKKQQQQRAAAGAVDADRDVEESLLARNLTSVRNR
jgi:hypothetical protein